MKLPGQCAWAVMLLSSMCWAQPPANPLAKPESKPADVQPAVEPAKPAEVPVVKLIEAGAEPRQALRLKPAMGLAQATKLRMVMGMSMKSEEMGEFPSPPMPPIVMSYTLKAVSVSPEGDVGYDMAFTACGIEENAESPAEMVEAMKAALAPMAGITGSGVVTARGFNKDIQIKIPEGVNAAAGGLMDGMKQQMSQMGTPLPEEAVGAGAKWTVTSKFKSQGLAIEQVATVELISLIDGVAKMKMSVEQTAPANQTIKTPDMPEGVNVQVESLKSSGTGEFEQALASMAPRAAESKLVTNLEMKVTQEGGKAQKMSQKVTVDVKLLPVEAAKPAADKPDEAPAAK